MKKIKRVVRDVSQHWVGDGFPVRSLFSYAGETSSIRFCCSTMQAPMSSRRQMAVVVSTCIPTRALRRSPSYTRASWRIAIPAAVTPDGVALQTIALGIENVHRAVRLVNVETDIDSWRSGLRRDIGWC